MGKKIKWERGRKGRGRRREKGRGNFLILKGKALFNHFCYCFSSIFFFCKETIEMKYVILNLFILI